jgi:hypothetical protein
MVIEAPIIASVNNAPNPISTARSIVKHPRRSLTPHRES